MTTNNYFFYDGSALLGDIKRLRQTDASFAGARLNLVELASYFGHESLTHFHQAAYRRAVFYFVRGDPRIEKMVVRPDFAKPLEADDLRIEECGRRLTQVEKAQQWLDENQAPEYVREQLHRSEKAVDTQICCDALQLAGIGKLDRLFLYTNDSDFVPLVRALRQLGCNTTLIRLNEERVNAELVQECDSFGTVSSAWKLRNLFGLPDHPVPPDQPG